MEVKIKKFNENVDVNEVSNLIFKVQKNNGLMDPNKSLESIRKELEELRKKYKFVIFEGYDINQLVGLLLLFTNTPKFGIIWDWHPVVVSNSNKKQNARKMIKECIVFAEDNDITRIEVCFTIQNDTERRRYREYLKLYETLNFYHVIEEAEMELNLNEKKFKKIKFPGNYEIKPFTDVEISNLFHIAFEIMNESEDDMFLDLKEEQKWTVVQNYFNPPERIIPQASFILTQENKIVGYSIAKRLGSETSKVTIGAFGICPNFRGKGLGKALLLYSLSKLKTSNFERVNLDVAVENKPAYRLYLKLGFKKLYSTNILALNC